MPAYRAGRQTLRMASLTSLYGALGSAPLLGVMPEGVRNANAPPPEGCSEHQYETYVCYVCVWRLEEEGRNRCKVGRYAHQEPESKEESRTRVGNPSPRIYV